MSDEQQDFEALQAQPAVQALKRIVNDDGFRDEVVRDAGAALASYELSGEAVGALSADAETLTAEVAGFARSERPEIPDEVVAQLRTPTLMQMPLGVSGAPMMFCRVSS